MARGVAVDLLQRAKRVGPQCEAARHKDLFEEESFSLAIKPFVDRTVELSTKAPMSVSKLADLGYGVLNCAFKVDGNRRQGTQCFTQVRALSMEVIPYVLLD